MPLPSLRLLPLLIAGALLAACGASDKPESQSDAQARPAAGDAKAARPALSVTLVNPLQETWPQTLSANGNVMAWQEAVIGAEVANYRITEVRAQVGDRVRKGQVLARIDDDTVAAELAEARAAVAELEASAGEARANALRARELREKGFYSQQLATQYQTAEHTAQARLAAGQARLQSVRLRMGKTAVLAPDDGLISARSATVGSLTQSGQELFRLIRGGRLEWRAEVGAADLAKVQVGVPVMVSGPNGEAVAGRVRALAPSIDPATRNGLVYVDLPATGGQSGILKAGMFARGNFELGRAPAVTLPQSALVLREGFAYVFRLGDESRVTQTKVVLGRRQGERVEVLEGLPAQARVVASGAGFLADGDLVQVLAEEKK